MGDWYDNYLTVLGPTADRASFREKAVGVYPECDGPSKRTEALCFENFIPTPARVLQPDQRDACENWRIENWCAVYGAVNSKLRSEGEDRLKYYFEANFGPPVTFFQKIGLSWPTLTFLLDYCNGEGSITGICSVKGEICDCFELQYDPRKMQLPHFTNEEEFMALGAELKPKNPLVEGDFQYTGQFRSDHPVYKGMGFSVSHLTTKAPQECVWEEPSEIVTVDNPLLQ